jgi:protease-4
MASIVQALANGAYDDFIELVAAGRGMSEQAVKDVADGLVWTGVEAAERGLVDELGGLDEAVTAAARLAGVEDWRTARTRVPPSFESVLLQELSRSFGMVTAPLGGWFESLVGAFKPVVRSLSSLRDPMHVYAQCLNCAPLL